MAITASTPATRVALVTGAAQGLGFAIALRLAEDGLDVAVNDLPSKADALRVTVAQIQARGRRAIAVLADVSSEKEVQDMVDQTVAQLGALDVMVANAGILVVGPILDASVNEWDRIMSTNVRGVMLCYKYAAAQMIKQGRGGRIIGASSVAGKRGQSNISAYTATKFAVRGLTQSAALEFAPHKITVNAYAPGFIVTNMIGLPDDALNGGYGSTFKKMLGYGPEIPDAGPDAVANLVSYFVQPAAYFVTGQTSTVDGGVFFD